MDVYRGHARAETVVDSRLAVPSNQKGREIDFCMGRVIGTL